MNIKRVAFVVGGAFLAIIALAVCVSARFSLLNITSDPYAFISSFFNQWSLALSAAGTIILAISVFAFIFENRRREEQEKQQVTHALHNEIHWNLRPIITLRFDISEWSKRGEESYLMPSQEGLYRQIETRVFDDMRSRGQLHWLEELRMDVVFCYSLIDTYNLDRQFKPEHLELLTKLHERLDKAIRALEAKFNFLPLYVRYEDAGDTAEEVTNKTSYLSKQGKSDNVLKNNLSYREPITFKPLPWGILFFSFWASLRSAIENPSLLVQLTEWFFLGLSGILLLAVFTQPLFPIFRRILAKHIPRLDRIVTRENVIWFFASLVFLTALIGLPADIVLSWSKLQGIDFSISVVGLVCWVVAYLLVFVAMVSQIGKKGRVIGEIASVIIIGSAINVFQSDVLAGCILLGIGVASIIIVIKPPKGIWHLREVV